MKENKSQSPVRRSPRTKRKRHRASFGISAWPEEIKEQICIRRSALVPYKEIVAWLEAEHGLKTHDTCIARFWLSRVERESQSEELRKQALTNAIQFLQEGCRSLSLLSPIEGEKLRAFCFDAVARAASVARPEGQSPGTFAETHVAAHSAQGEGKSL